MRIDANEAVAGTHGSLRDEPAHQVLKQIAESGSQIKTHFVDGSAGAIDWSGELIGFTIAKEGCAAYLSGRGKQK